MVMILLKNLKIPISIFPLQWPHSAVFSEEITARRFYFFLDMNSEWCRMWMFLSYIKTLLVHYYTIIMLLTSAFSCDKRVGLLPSEFGGFRFQLSTDLMHMKYIYLHNISISVPWQGFGTSWQISWVSSPKILFYSFPRMQKCPSKFFAVNKMLMSPLSTSVWYRV